MPLSAGNIRETSFVDLWEKSDIFNSFRYPQLKGKCGDCDTRTSAAVAVRAPTSIMATGWMKIMVVSTPKGGEKIKVAFNTAEESPVEWDGDSETRLNRFPTFCAHGKKGRREARTRESHPLILLS